MTDNSGKEAPEWIDKYKILKELGGGGYGLVYLVSHTDLPDRYYALKLLKSPFESSETEMASFLQEARFLEVIKGPNFLSVEAFGFFEDIPYIVTEYIENGSLRDLLEKQPSRLLSVDKSLTILARIGSALTIIHQISVVHGDLKPENILLREQDQALLSDFGNATFLGTMDFVNTDEIKGTFAYMSPEQFSKKIGRPSDQYALGCIAYELFTGQLPFTTSDPNIWKQKHETEAPRPLREVNPALEANIELATLTALAKEPSQRHTDVAEFIKQLRTTTSSSGIVIPNPTPPHSPNMNTASSIIKHATTDATTPPVIQDSNKVINNVPVVTISTPESQPQDHPPSLYELQLPASFIQLLTPALKATGLTTNIETVYHPRSYQPYMYTRLDRKNEEPGNQEPLRCLLHIDDFFLKDMTYFDSLSVMLQAFEPNQFLIIFLDIPRLLSIELDNLFKGEMKDRVNFIAKPDLDKLPSLIQKVYPLWLASALKLEGLSLQITDEITVPLPPDQLDPDDADTLARILSSFEQSKNDSRFWHLLFESEGLRDLERHFRFDEDDRYSLVMHVVPLLFNHFVTAKRKKRDALGLLLSNLLKYRDLPQDYRRDVLAIINKYRLVQPDEFGRLKGDKP